MAPPRTRKDSGPRDGDDAAPQTVQAVDSILTDAPEGPLPPVVEVLAEADDPAPPRAEPPAPPPPPVSEPQRKGGAGGMIALLLGGAIAAGAGFGLSRVVPGGWPLQDTSSLETQLAAQSAQVSDLLAAVQALPAPEPLDPLRDQIAALSAELTDLRTALTAARAEIATLRAAPGPDLSALEARLSALESLPPGEALSDSAALAALSREMETLRAEVEAEKGATAGMAAEVAAAAEAAQAELAAAQAEAERLRSEAAAEARRAALLTALGRVETALANGASFADPLADLAAAGVAVPDVLTANAAGLPGLPTLQAAFADPAREALRVSLQDDMGDTLTERLGTFLRSQTGARSLTPREGSGADAVLSRAEAALHDGRIADALAELSALPETGQAAMAGWVAQAALVVQARDAVAQIAAGLEE